MSRKKVVNKLEQCVENLQLTISERIKLTKDDIDILDGCIYTKNILSQSGITGRIKRATMEIEEITILLSKLLRFKF